MILTKCIILLCPDAGTHGPCDLSKREGIGGCGGDCGEKRQEKQWTGNLWSWSPDQAFSYSLGQVTSSESGLLCKIRYWNK